MKIKPEHLEYMRSTIAQCDCLPSWDIYSRAGLPHEQYRWAVFSIAGLIPWACANIYSYADDSHIDTALRAILKPEPIAQGDL